MLQSYIIPQLLFAIKFLIRFRFTRNLLGIKKETYANFAK